MIVGNWPDLTMLTPPPFFGLWASSAACNNCFPGALEDCIETGQTRCTPERFDPGTAAAISER